jgi:phage-related protein
MTDELKPIALDFWKSAAGQEPDRDWFRNLLRADRAVLGRDLRRLQYGWPVGMPLVRPLGKGLWELRSSLPGKKEARVLFAVDAKGILVLNAFIKKSRKTPDHELKLARQRLKEAEQ